MRFNPFSRKPTKRQIVQERLDTVQDKLGATLQDTLETVQETLDTVQGKLSNTVQDTFDSVQGKFTNTVQERFCTPVEQLEARRKPHNWGADLATGIAALLLVGLFTGLTRNRPAARREQDAWPAGAGHVDFTNPTGVYPAPALTNDTTRIVLPNSEPPTSI